MARSGKLTVLKVAAVARAKIPGYYSDGVASFCKSAALAPHRGYSVTG
jgi:hypothetical protein